MIRWILPTLVLSLAACDSSGDAGFSPPSEGDLYPTATLETCEGSAVEMSDYIASHDVSFITFGAQWCTACQEEAPIINAKLVDGLDASRVGVMQILVELGRGEAPTQRLCTDWVEDLETRFDVTIDPNATTIAQHFGAGVSDLPLHYVVTSDGVIRFRKLGPLPADIDVIVSGWLP